MEHEKNFDKNGIFSKRVRAGKRRTYFFDVRETKGSDYYITITESKKRFNEENYDRHKIFIYKEDFIKFVNAMQETIDFIKAELLPDYDFSAHSHDSDQDDDREYRSGSNYREQDKEEEQAETSTEEAPAEPEAAAETPPPPPPSSIVPPTIDDVDKWD